MAEQGPIAITESPDFLVAEINGHPARVKLAGSVNGARRTALGEVAFTTVAAIDAAMSAGKKYRPGTLVIDSDTNLVLGIINGDGVLSSAGGGSATPLVGALTSNSVLSALRADQGPVILAALATKYALPAGGVPESDLASAVQTKLNNPTVAAATSGTRGSIRLTGDLGGTADTPTVPALAGKQNTLTSVADVPGLVTALDAKLDAADMATINGQSLSTGGNISIASGLPTTATWTTTWDATGNKDVGGFTVTGALALLATTSGAIPGGRTQGVLIGDGSNVPTFSGVSASGYNLTGRTTVSFWSQGSNCFWSVGDSIIYVPTTGPAVEITRDSEGGTAATVMVAPTTAIPLDTVGAGKAFSADTISSGAPLTIAAGQVEGGSCTLVIKGNGSAWGGITGALKAVGSAAFVTTLDAVNHVLVWVEGGRVRYTVSQSDPVEVVTTPVAPTNPTPTIVTAVVGSALVWAGGVATGTPTPTTTYSWRTSAGVLIQDNITSGSYTLPEAGNFILRMTSTNSAGTDVDDVAVTVVSGASSLRFASLPSPVTESGSGPYSYSYTAEAGYAPKKLTSPNMKFAAATTAELVVQLVASSSDAESDLSLVTVNDGSAANAGYAEFPNCALTVGKLMGGGEGTDQLRAYGPGSTTIGGQGTGPFVRITRGADNLLTVYRGTTGSGSWTSVGSVASSGDLFIRWTGLCASAGLIAGLQIVSHSGLVAA